MDFHKIIVDGQFNDLIVIAKYYQKEFAMDYFMKVHLNKDLFIRRELNKDLFTMRELNKDLFIRRELNKDYYEQKIQD